MCDLAMGYEYLGSTMQSKKLRLETRIQVHAFKLSRSPKNSTYPSFGNDVLMQWYLDSAHILIIGKVQSDHHAPGLRLLRNPGSNP